MKADQLRLLIQKELSDRKLNWYVGVVGGVVMIHGLNRSISNNDLLARIDFLQGPSNLVLINQDEGIKQIIIAIYDKFQVTIDDDATEDESGIRYLIYIAAGAALSFCLVAAGFIYAICNYQLPK